MLKLLSDIITIKDQSFFYVLKNNFSLAKPTGGTHWIEFLPNHVYCFLPSIEVDVGKVRCYDHMPEYVKDFLFCMEITQNIEMVAIIIFAF
jgi:hypothetical protein